MQIRRQGLGPATELGEVISAGGLRTLTNVFGVPVHLVTRFEDVRRVLLDHARFSNAAPAGFVMPGAPPRPAEHDGDPRAGNLLGLDPPDHQRLRRILIGEFTARPMNLLAPRIEAIVERQLDAMEEHGPSADVVSMFALPIPSLVICELLGVPHRDREEFQRRSDSLIDVAMPFAERYRLQRESHDYLHSLVQQARGEAGDDLLGRLVSEHGDAFDDGELTAVCGLLLLAGHETTSGMLGLGALALLRHPEQLAAVRDDPSVTATAVEELLRYLSVLHHSIPRVATVDVELCGVRVVAGDLVLASLMTANRDPAFVDDPDVLNVRRAITNHVAFGHGIHRCLGAPLAQLELRIALPALLRRFPRLALAEDFDAIEYQAFHLIYGLRSLSVAW